MITCSQPYQTRLREGEARLGIQVSRRICKLNATQLTLPLVTSPLLIIGA